MPTPSVEEVRAWSGRVMIDRDGNRLGEITDIYLDRETDRPEWAVVHTGLFGLRSSFVPLAEATETGDPIAARMCARNSGDSMCAASSRRFASAHAGATLR